MTPSPIEQGFCRSFLFLQPAQFHNTPENYQQKQFTDHYHAMAFLARLRLSESYWRDFYLRSGGVGSHQMSHQELLHWAARKLVAGQFRCYEKLRQKFAGGSIGGESGGSAYTKFEQMEEPHSAAEEPPEVEETITFDAQPLENEEEKNWVEFLLLDDDTGEPMANIPLKLKLPDGSSVKVTSDANGCVRCDDIAAGNCEIEEILDEEALEVSAFETV